jgi:hypothetical protein
MSSEEERFERSGGPSRRWAVVVVLVLGVALIVAPFAFGMFSKAPKGATMMAEFKPFMTTAQLDGYQTDLHQINAGVHQTDTSVASFLSGGSAHTASFDRTYPEFATFDKQWPAIYSTMTHLMNEVQGNLGNYQAISALPGFKLFPWFFVLPGVLLAALAAVSLLSSVGWRRARWVLAVLGVGLIVAPAAFQMFTRAPKGGRMMSAFTQIETTQNVEHIQGYFGSMAVGQGAIRLDVVPALEKAGLSRSQIADRFPAVTTLDARWIHILNTMTPMIGAMSDNVVNYQALTSLPPFPLFPWFFAVPGALTIGLVAVGGVKTSRRTTDAPELQEVRLPSLPIHEGAS